MRRRGPRRDLGLSVRLVVALACVAALYLVAALVFVLLLLAAVAQRNWGAFFGALLIGGGLVFLARQHVVRAADLALRAAGAKKVEPHEEHELQALVARTAAAADLPAPSVALVRSWAPNAFAAGLSPERTTIAFTTELLRRLDERELEAVVAHELAHVANRDGIVMTFVSAPAVLGPAIWHADDARAKLLFFYYLPLYLTGLVLLWTISRYREYVADRGACLITGAPEQLQSALLKIADVEPRGDLRGGGGVSALCIVAAQRRLRWYHVLRRLEIFMDHPPVEKRVARLAEIAEQLGEER